MVLIIILLFSFEEFPLAFLDKLDLVVMNSLSFWVIFGWGAFLSFLHVWRTVLLSIVIVTDRYFPFNILNIQFPTLLACKVSVDEFPYTFMGGFLYVLSQFSLAAFNILFFFFYYGKFNYVYQYIPFQVQPIWGPLGLMNLIHFSAHVWELFNHYCFKYIFCSSLSFFSF